jgi:TonB family protein
MRRILAASVLLAPMLFTAAASASQPAIDDANASTPIRPISTGVIPAHVLYSPNIEFPTSVSSDLKFVVQLNVDELGKPHDVLVVNSINPDLDASVATAVRQFRFRPATLDKQAVAVPLTLTLVVKR